MFLLENNRMQQQLTDVTGRYEIAQADLNKAKDSFAGIKEEYERVVSEIERLEEEIGRERENLSNASELRGKLEVQINILKEQIRSAQYDPASVRNGKASEELPPGVLCGPPEQYENFCNPAGTIPEK